MDVEDDDIRFEIQDRPDHVRPGRRFTDNLVTSFSSRVSLRKRRTVASSSTTTILSCCACCPLSMTSSPAGRAINGYRPDSEQNQCRFSVLPEPPDPHQFSDDVQPE
jgi:hypothetical protein